MSDIRTFLDALVYAWDSSTAHPSTLSSSGFPNGQCVVTALVVQDYFGGMIVRGRTRTGSHYWNLITGMGEIDLTRDQYDPGEPITRDVSFVQREDLLQGERAVAARTAERYALLKKRVVDYMNFMARTP